MKHCILPIVFFFVSCASTTLREPAGETSNQFFDEHVIYAVSIHNWDSRYMDAHSFIKEENRERHAQKIKTESAWLDIGVADAHADAGCPVNSQAPFYKVSGKDFELTLSGNKTLEASKANFKIKFEENKGLHGMEVLSLKSMVNDVSQMRESLAWELMQKANVKAPRHAYAKLCMNGRYYGLYSIIENIDESFVKEHFDKNDRGNLYKANWNNDDLGPATLQWRKDGIYLNSNIDVEDRSYGLKTNKKKSKEATDLIQFIQVLNGKPDNDGKTTLDFKSDEYMREMEEIFDVKSFLRWASLNTLLGSWDNYWQTPGNYFLYNGGSRDEPKKFAEKPYFTWIPWDYDNSMGISYGGDKMHYVNHNIVQWDRDISKPRLPLFTNLMKNNKFKAYYLDHMEFLLDNYFQPTPHNARLDADLDAQFQHSRAHMFPGVLRDRWFEEMKKGGWVNKHLGKQWHLIHDAVRVESQSGRTFTWDDVFAAVVLHRETQNIGFAYSIQDYVIMREGSAREQLKKLRKSIPKGSSGEKFKN